MAQQAQGEARDLASLLQELTARSVSDQARAMERYRELLEQVAGGELDVATVRAQYERLVAEQSAQLARDVTALGVQFYQAIVELNRSYIDRLFDQLAGGAGAAPPPEPAPEPAPAEENGAPEEPPAPVELTLGGKVGEVANTSFVIENKRGDPAEVVFLLSDFTSDEGEPFRAPIKLDPPRFELEPHAERPVTLSLDLDGELFTPGRSYRGEVLVRGNDDLTLRLVVDVAE